MESSIVFHFCPKLFDHYFLEGQGKIKLTLELGMLQLDACLCMTTYLLISYGRCEGSIDVDCIKVLRLTY